MSHQWATFIHGKILTRLAATSLKLEQAVGNDDNDNFEVGLANIKSVLSDPTREFEKSSFDLKSEISSRLDPWEGLIAINFKTDPELADISNDRVKDLGEVIEEIISNSVRHPSTIIKELPLETRSISASALMQSALSRLWIVFIEITKSKDLS